MAFKQRLNRLLEYLNIPHVTVFLVAGQALVYVLVQSNPEAAGRLVLVFDRVFAGEVWRLLTAPFFPPAFNIIFFLIALWFFYFLGTTLENHWGSKLYNLYLLVGYLATLLAGMAYPDYPIIFAMIGPSLFLAFATLYPKLVIYAFFVIPIEARWLGLLTWIFYGYIFATGGAAARAEALASLVNYAIFFGPMLFSRIRGSHRALRAQSQRAAETQRAFHVCRVCGITDKTNPEMEFRYCPQCKGSPGYCSEHIRNHQHIT